MNIQENVPLKDYLTMGLGGNAHYMVDATTADELANAWRMANEKDWPVFVLGGGSNIIAGDAGFDGLVIRNHILGFDVLDETEDGTTVKIGAGEDWDSVVARTTAKGLSGIEAMSAIPGTTGGAPVQNVGAYGQEIADTLVELDAYDSHADKIVTLPAADCEFSYRHSIFRGSQSGRYGIVSITLRLKKSSPTPPFYAALQTYFDAHGIVEFTPQAVRDAVVAIRRDKLPDPRVVANTGSFFKNAIVDQQRFDTLLQQWPTMPHYTMSDGRIKIPSGWLIEQAGFKGKLLHGMRVHDKNTLVLKNESATSYGDLAAARQEIIDGVSAMFGIIIEQEPLELHTTI